MVDRDTAKLVHRAVFLTQAYLNQVRFEMGLFPGETDSSPAIRSARDHMLEYAHSAHNAATLELHDMTPEEYVESMPDWCLFGALRQAFIPIEKQLEKIAGWTCGVPFSGIDGNGGWRSCLFRRVGWDWEKHAADRDTAEAEASALLESLEEEFESFRMAADAVYREIERTLPAGCFGYLDLRVDVEKQTVERKGYNNVVDLAGLAVLWHTFSVFYAAGKVDATREAWGNNYPGEWGGHRQALAELRAKLALLDVTVLPRERHLTSTKRQNF